MTTVTTASGAPVAATTKSAGIGADFNLFLKMLTTQMQNQDPLKPMDSTEYTAQLAQYSQVEQTMQQTTTLKDILARFSSQDMSQGASFIGREATFASATAGLGASTPATWGYTPARDVSAVTATIKDATGRVVATKQLDAKGGRFEWDGAQAIGGRASAGSYTLSIAATDVNAQTVPVTVTSIGRVDEVSSKNGVVTLGVNGATLPMSTLLKVAAADA
jgi:flagellar basal-body rod modification protein FlgD